MRKMIFGMNCTLDGYIAGPNGEDDWALADDELHDYSTRLIESGDLMLFGRVIYQMLAAYWPTAEQTDPSLSESMKVFGRTINAIPKILYSRTLQPTGWNTRVEKELVPEEVVRLKQQPGKNLIVAGSALAHSLMRYGLIDEFHLLVHPTILGGGKPLFPLLNERINLKRIRTENLQSGVVAMFYEVVR